MTLLILPDHFGEGILGLFLVSFLASAFLSYFHEGVCLAASALAGDMVDHACAHDNVR